MRKDAIDKALGTEQAGFARMVVVMQYPVNVKHTHRSCSYTQAHIRNGLARSAVPFRELGGNVFVKRDQGCGNRERCHETPGMLVVDYTHGRGEDFRLVAREAAKQF